MSKIYSTNLIEPPKVCTHTKIFKTGHLEGKQFKIKTSVITGRQYIKV